MTGSVCDVTGFVCDVTGSVWNVTGYVCVTGSVCDVTGSVCDVTGSVSTWKIYATLGAFAKLRKATIIFVMSVRPSVRMEQLGFHRTDFHEI